MFKKPSFGYDPEFFLKIKGTDELYPSIGLFGGTKEEKKPLPRLGKGFGIEEDNVAVEMTAPPANSKEEFVGNLANMVQHLKDVLIPGINSKKITPELDLDTRCSGNFEKKYLESKQAKTFGCSPEMNAYTYDMFVASAENAANFRTCGGHIHIGWEGDKSMEIATMLIRAMDLYLGLASLFLDEDENRRKLYGKAGSCRITSYGVEYRTLSNFWVFNTDFSSWVYDQTLEAIKNVEIFKDNYSSTGMQVQHAINTNDKGIAAALMEQFKIKFPTTKKVLV